MGEMSHTAWCESVVKSDIELINSRMDVVIKSLEHAYARVALLRKIILMPKRLCVKIVRLFYGK
jgi:hypothetical protein